MNIRELCGRKISLRLYSEETGHRNTQRCDLVYNDFCSSILVYQLTCMLNALVDNLSVVLGGFPVSLC